MTDASINQEPTSDKLQESNINSSLKKARKSRLEVQLGSNSKAILTSDKLPVAQYTGELKIGDSWQESYLSFICPSPASRG